MNRIAQLFLSLVLAAAAAGCAAQDPSGGPSDRPTRISSSGPITSPEQQSSKQAVSVTFRLSGGLEPTDETVVFAAGESLPSGRTKGEVRGVLEAASDPELVDVDMEPMPKDQCCDRQTYVVSIRWDDGSSRTYTSIDGLEQPQVFEELLTKVV
ncbi:MAG: hypothetical protein H0X54_00220 [Propionibacteriales bacterium]|jgi:hypothetical protein|nr:hypothetical protein [Propionibacteriales bacterium]